MARIPSTFFERIDELKRRIGGPGPIELKNEVDQVYAFNVHEGYWINYMGRFGPKTLHVHSGESHFLQRALLEGSNKFMQHVASVLYDEGSRAPMIENAIELVADTSARTPVEFGDLAESGHATVTDEGAIVYDEPPIVGRLNRAQVGRKREKLKRGDMARTYLPKGHPRHGTIHPRARGGHRRHPAHSRAPFELP